MKILIIGPTDDLAEARQKLGARHELLSALSHEEAKNYIVSSDVVFDFITSTDPSHVGIYRNATAIIFLNTTFITLKSLSDLDNVSAFGFCGLRSFFNREELETSVRKEEDIEQLSRICEKLSTKFQVVSDRIGMVTPRVICMIINEAFCTVEDGTATREDIDKAMKLGTNYPFGPFEWCSNIGAENVVKLLKAMNAETDDVRYNISALLEQEALGLKN